MTVLNRMKIIKTIKKTELSKIMLLGLYIVFFIELTLKNFHLGPASIRTVILLLLIIFFVWNEVFIKKRELLSFYDFIRDPIIKFSILFFLWHIITFLIIHRSEFDPNLTLRMLISIYIPILCISFLKSKKSIKIFIYIGISALFLSSLVAVLQQHIGEPFISIPAFLGDINPELRAVSLQTKRYFGLTESNLRLAYDIVNIFPLLMAILLVGTYRKKTIIKNKIILLIMAATILYALILTGTRSAFFGIIIGILFSIFVIGINQKKLFLNITKKLAVFTIIILVLAIVTDISKVRSFKRIKDIYEVHSAGQKIPKLISGLKASKKALLFGTGSPIVEPLESEEEIPSFLRKYSIGTGGARVHNIFINNLLLGGIPRLLLLIIFLSLIIINVYSLLAKVINSNAKKEYLLYCFGFSIWIIAYIFDKLVHNADPFNDVLFWYVLGSMMALSRIFKKEEAATALRASQ